MRSLTEKRLKIIFDKGLKFTPTSGQINAFAGDLRRLNAQYWYEALLSLVKSKRINGKIHHAGTLRQMAHRVYARKMAEASELGVLLGTFESAYRSTIAVSMEDHYGTQRWWRPVEEAMRQGLPLQSVVSINGRPVSRDFVETVSRLLLDIDGDRNRLLTGRKLLSCKTGYHLLGHSNLYHLQVLIEYQWTPVFNRPYFGRPGRPGLTKGKFHEKFERVRKARNELFHHRPVAGKADVIRVAEELLDYIDVSARYHVQAVTVEISAPMAFGIPADKVRHNL